MLVRQAGVASVIVLGLALGGVPLPAQQSVKLPARDRPLTERPATLFTVGAEEGESWELFSGIRGAAFDRADNLYVLDSQNSRVVVFDARGRFVRQFGRRGGGPGELQSPMHIAVTAADEVVVNDLGNRAFVVYSPAGEHVRNVPYPQDAGFPTAFMAAPRGGVITRTSDALRMQTPQPTGQPATSTIARHALAGDAAPSTITTFRIAPPQVLENSNAGGQTRRVSISVDPIFSARPSFGPLPDGGIALHTDTEYAVRILDGAGRHVRTLERDHRPRRVTKKDQEAYQARQQEQRERGGTGAPIMVMSTTGGGTSGGAQPRGGSMQFNVEPTYADFMSVITSVRTDAAGRLWIQRRHDDGSERGSIDLVDATGRYIGTLPPQQAPNAFSASGLAAYVITDDLGVERVAVRRLPASWR
jgi:hypothetical protein